MYNDIIIIRIGKETKLNMIYFDNAATTRILPEVIEEMNKSFEEHWGNPSSTHRQGQKSRAAIEKSRETIAKLLQVDAKEIIFTSGGAESNNLILRGALKVNESKGKHLITSKIEHSTVLKTCQALEKEGYAKESIDKYLELFELLKDRKDVAEGVAFLKDKLGDFLDQEVADSLTEIATAVNATKNAEFTLVFDPTLVRGMSYYTGTIFEIAMPELGAACGGGGRYDKMIGKFTGNDVPACGFSIGFERIILLLMESGFKIPERPKRVAYLVEKKYPAEKLVDVMKQAKEARENGQQVLVVRMNKNKKFQKEQLSKEGYEEFEEFFNK